MKHEATFKPVSGLNLVTLQQGKNIRNSVFKVHKHTNRVLKRMQYKKQSAINRFKFRLLRKKYHFDDWATVEAGFL